MEFNARQYLNHNMRVEGDSFRIHFTNTGNVYKAKNHKDFVNLIDKCTLQNLNDLYKLFCIYVYDVVDKLIETCYNIEETNKYLYQLNNQS